MISNKIIIRSIVILALAGISSAGEVQELSPHVSLCRDSVNGVFIGSQGQVLVEEVTSAGWTPLTGKQCFQMMSS